MTIKLPINFHLSEITELKYTSFLNRETTEMCCLMQLIKGFIFGQSSTGS